ncbi:MAG TPA: YIP1 family protein [Parasulfuritortus sp.]
MKLSTISHLPLSADQGWPEIERAHPHLVKLYALIVLPLSLLPPAMLYYAGTQYPDSFLHQAANKNWGEVAAAFFLTELFTLLAMGWLIKQVAETNNLRIDYHDSFLLAGIAPIPLWLSSLGLFAPSLGFNAVLSLIALGLSCGVIYHGIEGLCHTHEDVTAAGIVHTVIGAGLIAWALLLMWVLPL